MCFFTQESGVSNELLFQFKYYSKYDHNPREMSKRMMTKAKVWVQYF